MLTLSERAINNTFQIIEDLEANAIRGSFYHSPKKVKSSLRSQLPGKVKTFSEEEVFLFKVRRFIRSLNER